LETTPEKKRPLQGTEINNWVKIDSSQFQFSRVQAARSSLNAVATSIRTADIAMDRIGKQIDDMKHKLQTHLKNYPPFLAGSEERVELLKSFSAFRRQIEQLTIPPDDSDAADIMSISPSHGDEKWAIVVEQNGMGKGIHRQPVHAGQDGVNIPEMPSTATDSDLESMVKVLDAARNTLDRRRSGLAEDAKSVIQTP
jgi:hypothetical protein